MPVAFYGRHILTADALMSKSFVIRLVALTLRGRQTPWSCGRYGSRMINMVMAFISMCRGRWRYGSSSSLTVEFHSRLRYGTPHPLRDKVMSNSIGATKNVISSKPSVSCGGVNSCMFLIGATHDVSFEGINACLLRLDRRWCDIGRRRGYMGRHQPPVYPLVTSG